MKTSTLTQKKYLDRNSGIELLKNIAIFLIVISHVLRALRLGKQRFVFS